MGHYGPFVTLVLHFEHISPPNFVMYVTQAPQL